MKYIFLLSIAFLLTPTLPSGAQTRSPESAERARGYFSAGAGFSSKGISVAGDINFGLQDSPWRIGIGFRKDIAEFIFTEDYLQWVGVVASHAWTGPNHSISVGGGLGHVTGMREVRKTDPNSWECFMGCPSEELPSTIGALIHMDALTHSSWLGLGVQPYVMISADVTAGVTFKLFIGRF